MNAANQWSCLQDDSEGGSDFRRQTRYESLSRDFLGSPGILPSRASSSPPSSPRRFLSSSEMAELGQLVWARYPGYEEDLRARWEEDQEECEGDTLSDWDTDSECETERTEDSHWPGLTGLAQQATALATTTQPPVISDVATSELDWLLTLQKHNLPALLLSQNKRTVTSLLSHLMRREAIPGPHLLIVPVTTISSWSS